MKTKTLFTLCLLLGIGLTQVSAQKNGNSDGTYTIADYRQINNFFIPIYCDGVLTDELDGAARVHRVRHYKNGVLEFTIYRAKGEATSLWTQEQFTFMELIFIEVSKEGILLCHDNVKGDKGTLYNISLIVDWPENTWVVKNATCTGNTK